MDENNLPVAVQLDLETFRKIEEVLENQGLAQLMREGEDEEPLDLAGAESYYRQLSKAR